MRFLISLIEPSCYFLLISFCFFLVIHALDFFFLLVCNVQCSCVSFQCIVLYFHLKPHHEAASNAVCIAPSFFFFSDQAITARDSMAKSLYSALFDWIVLRINHALLNKKDMEESVPVRVQKQKTLHAP